MKRTDLFSEAEKNAAAIDSEYATVSTEEHIRFFEAAISENGLVSTNRKQDALRDLLNGQPQKLLSGHEISQRQGISFPMFLEMVWPPKQRQYFRRRLFFMFACSNGEEHLFGALNLGNAGAAAYDSTYGEYCIVMRPGAIQEDMIAYCRYDTLAHDAYWTCDWKLKERASCSNCPYKEADQNYRCEIDPDVMLSDYAPHSHRGKLAAMKYADSQYAGARITSESSVDDYPDILIQKRGKKTEDYIEACFVADIGPSQIKEVRFHEKLAPRILREAAANPGDVGSFVHGHQELERLMAEHGIKGFWSADNDAAI